MVTPQVPTGWAVRHTILDDEPHGQVNHPVGVMTPGWGQVREVQIEIFTALCTVVLRIGNDQVPWTPSVEITEIMQRALLALVTIGVAPTIRTGVLCEVATAVNELRLWEFLRACDAFRGIRPIDTGSWHIWGLLDNNGGASNIRRHRLACLHATRFLYYSVIR
jgi:hypothetical protein